MRVTELLNYKQVVQERLLHIASLTHLAKAPIHLVILPLEATTIAFRTTQAARFQVQLRLLPLLPSAQISHKLVLLLVLDPRLQPL